MSIYTDWSPGQAIAASAALYTELVNAKLRPTQRPHHHDQPQRDEAQTITCPQSPSSHGPLSHHTFGINNSTCAFCDETPAWILAAPTHKTGQPA